MSPVAGDKDKYGIVFTFYFRITYRYISCDRDAVLYFGEMEIIDNGFMHLCAFAPFCVVHV